MLQWRALAPLERMIQVFGLVVHLVESKQVRHPQPLSHLLTYVGEA